MKCSQTTPAVFVSGLFSFIGRALQTSKASRCFFLSIHMREIRDLGNNRINYLLHACLPAPYWKWGEG